MAHANGKPFAGGFINRDDREAALLQFHKGKGRLGLASVRGRHLVNYGPDRRQVQGGVVPATTRCGKLDGEAHSGLLRSKAHSSPLLTDSGKAPCKFCRSLKQPEPKGRPRTRVVRSVGPE